MARGKDESDDEIPVDDNNREIESSKKDEGGGGKKKKKYDTRKPKAIHPIVRKFTDWVRASQIEAELLGFIPLPLEVIDEGIEPAAQRIFQHFVPEGMAGDLIALAPVALQSYSVSKLGKVARKQGAKVQATDDGPRLIMPDGNTVIEFLKQQASRKAAA